MFWSQQFFVSVMALLTPESSTLLAFCTPRGLKGSLRLPPVHSLDIYDELGSALLPAGHRLPP